MTDLELEVGVGRHRVTCSQSSGTVGIIGLFVAEELLELRYKMERAGKLDGRSQWSWRGAIDRKSVV